jgi:hypothetical protein
MKELGALLKARHSRLEVHSYGACDNNMGAAASADLNEGIKHNKKIDLFRQYKFCVVSAACQGQRATCTRRVGACLHPCSGPPRSHRSHAAWLDVPTAHAGHGEQRCP